MLFRVFRAIRGVKKLSTNPTNIRSNTKRVALDLSGKAENIHLLPVAAFASALHPNKDDNYRSASLSILACDLSGSLIRNKNDSVGAISAGVAGR